MHSPVPSSEITEALIHIRDLFRRIRPSNERELRAFERREAATKDLLSNLPRTNEHPTLRTLLEIAEIYSLTLEGAHRLFGYSLQDIRELDLDLNRGRTHIFESYPFERDLLVDLPARLAPSESFAADAFLRDLVIEWQTGIPLRTLEEEGWEQPGTYYVHVGTEDSLGSSIPPGAMALVEPIGETERSLPNPRSIYLLQFANGYRCSHCIVTKEQAPVIQHRENISWARGICLSRIRTHRGTSSDVRLGPSHARISCSGVASAKSTRRGFDPSLGTSHVETDCF